MVFRPILTQYCVKLFKKWATLCCFWRFFLAFLQLQTFGVYQHHLCLRIIETSGSVVAERPRNALCPSVVRRNKIINCAESFIIVTYRLQIYRCVQLNAVQWRIQEGVGGG